MPRDEYNPADPIRATGAYFIPVPAKISLCGFFAAKMFLFLKMSGLNHLKNGGQGNSGVKTYWYVSCMIIPQ
jgi:hypothetical protein